jgi:hypothetical protein
MINSDAAPQDEGGNPLDERKAKSPAEISAGLFMDTPIDRISLQT